MVMTVVMQMVGAFDFPAARQDEDMSVGAHDVDIGAIQPR
jgi:hypothetical protein